MAFPFAQPNQPSSVLLKAVGLNVSPNLLDVPPGSLLTASNVVIRRDGIIEPRRGYKVYGDTFGSTSDRAKQLVTYKNRILLHYSNQLLYDSNGSGTFQAFGTNNLGQTYLEPQTGQKIRTIESNGNLYFTTTNGIQRISATAASDFTTSNSFIQAAGGLKALDVTSWLALTPGNQTGFFTQDSQVAYRILWGYNDMNGNLIQGTPSQREVISNPLLSLLLLDFCSLTNALNETANNTSTSLINSSTYNITTQYPTTSSTSATTLLSNAAQLATDIDNDLLYADTTTAPLVIASGAIVGSTCTITFSSGNPTSYWTSGSKIYLAGFATGAGSINGAQTIATVNSTTITFTTTASGAVTVTGSTIVGNQYRSITQPSAPSSPATDAQLVTIQTYIQNIITQLQSEPSATISSSSQTNFISPLDITTTANVNLKFTIPSGASTSTFYQVYRSDISAATGTQVLSEDIAASDELKLVYEGFPTSTDISNGYVQIADITPASFAGAFLYTDETNGEGILQSNDLPPCAIDIVKFKNYIFYANTRTRQRELINLLGVTNMISDYNNSITPTFTISDGTTTNTYTFVTGVSQRITVTTIADVAGALAGKYFNFSSYNTDYYCWYSVSGSGSDPAISNRTGIKVYINTGDTANTIAAKTSEAISPYINDFTVAVSTNVVTLTNVAQGPATAPANGTSGFTTATTISGRGENVSNKQILLSTLVSPAQAVDATARSLVRVLNRNSSELVYAYYLSGANDIPGKMLFEERNLGTSPFYVLGNDSNIGTSFSPIISPTITISSNTNANPTVITTSAAHGLSNLDRVIITNSNSTPSINGVYTITKLSPTTFSIPVNVTVAGTTGSAIPVTSASASDNEVLANRIYYSKYLQPDAVPISNTIDVGAVNKAILRIFPLRDSLFVFKEDGLYRISGETTPFNVALFDISCILLAPDSLDVCNNYLYGWTTQGIVSVSESGATIISRPIDVDILKLATAQYVNFKTASWGMGYESDNSYTVYTVQSVDDTIAQIGFRYSTLTNTWTTFDKTNTCGIVNPFNDTQYLGCGDLHNIEQERKNFDRTDYSDHETSLQFNAGYYFGSQMILSSLTNIEVGDVITQDQQMTIYGYNSLLSKLDNDVTLTHTYSALQMNPGDDPRVKLDTLIDQVANDATRLSQAGATSAATYTAFKAINSSGTITNIAAGDPVVITTSTNHGLQTGRIITITGSNSNPSINGTWAVTVLTGTTFSIETSVTTVGTSASYTVQNDNFSDVKTSFNSLISTLNADTGVAFANYQSINANTLQEAVILQIDAGIKKVTLNNTLPWMIGPLTVYKSIESTTQWAPQTMNDPLNLKHWREATLMFENSAFSNAILSFSSDLLPEFIDVPFTGSSNGIFGFNQYGFNYFGGGGNAAPFRTYVPRNVQRCRYLNCQFTHQTAREKYSVLGLTLIGTNTGSSRAYR